MTLPYIIKQKIFSELLEMSDQAVFVLDDQFRYVFVNEHFCQMFSVSTDFVIGKPMSIFREESLSIESKLLIDGLLEDLLLRKSHQSNFSLTVRKGYTIKSEIKSYAMHAGGNIYYAGMLDQREIFDSKQLAEQATNYDPITQLPYKQYFIIQLGDLLLDTVNDIVVVRLSFDRFRTLKTNYSEDSINEIVKEFVQRIYALGLSNLTLFSRFSEENFALVFETDNVQVTRNDLAKILQLAERPYLIGKNPVYLHYSLGVCQFPLDGNQADVLIDNAEKALHHIKEKGGDDFCWFDEKLNKVSAEKLRLEAELRNALKTKQFFPVYQPKIDLDTKKIVGFEALVRWNHPQRGIQSPYYFLNSLLEYKLSFDLFCLMAEAVIQDLYAWQKKGWTQELCINADTYDFLHPQFIPFMEDLLNRYPVREGSLHVEVTENSLMQQYDIDILSQFQKLKDFGIRIALDDFGTGYASISYLRHYPFDYIKIDKSFVDDIEEVDTQLLMVRAIIDLANALDLYTVAEGIEKLSQVQIMHDMGCTIGQGYYFAKPMTIAEATAMVSKSRL